MKRINNFSKYNLIAESIIYFSDDFNSMLNSIRDEANYNKDYDVSYLANFLQAICGMNYNLSQNYVDVAGNGLNILWIIELTMMMFKLTMII